MFFSFLSFLTLFNRQSFDRNEVRNRRVESSGQGQRKFELFMILFQKIQWKKYFYYNFTPLRQFQYTQLTVFWIDRCLFCAFIDCYLKLLFIIYLEEQFDWQKLSFINKSNWLTEYKKQFQCLWLFQAVNKSIQSFNLAPLKSLDELPVILSKYLPSTAVYSLSKTTEH